MVDTPHGINGFVTVTGHIGRPWRQPKCRAPTIRGSNPKTWGRLHTTADHDTIKEVPCLVPMQCILHCNPWLILLQAALDTLGGGPNAGTSLPGSATQRPGGGRTLLPLCLRCLRLHALHLEPATSQVTHDRHSCSTFNSAVETAPVKNSDCQKQQLCKMFMFNFHHCCWNSNCQEQQLFGKSMASSLLCICCL